MQNIQAKLKTIKNNQIRGGTFISPNLKKTREMIDKAGNIIDPRTKQIIKPASK